MAHVVGLRMDLDTSEQYLTVTLGRTYAAPIFGPRAVDVPKDFRDALREWLDKADDKRDDEEGTDAGE